MAQINLKHSRRDIPYRPFTFLGTKCLQKLAVKIAILTFCTRKTLVLFCNLSYLKIPWPVSNTKTSYKSFVKTD